MSYNHIYAIHILANTLPHRKYDRELDDWMRRFRSIDQHQYSMFEIDSLRQCVVYKAKFQDRKSRYENIPNGESSAEEIIKINYKQRYYR